ncbi:DUF5919 domain-containing protein [Acrocarpospora catenulata]|uniref:DUF5919 domain-containing protein n=1 Tax=Acrocarpospora catenulata TaxID=2836182 RepID=UPI001BDABB9B|nr:DUF5919 domain-containing protein [Acrocarpospora catenulata]
MTEQVIRLKTLLQQRHWQSYSTFCREYDKAAQRVDPCLLGKWPSRAQLNRWVSGELKGLPYADHCRVLEEMFPGSTAAELFSPGPLPVPAQRTSQDDTPAPVHTSLLPSPTADVTAVFTSRSAFTAAHPPSTLFDNASEINAAGLSLNVICQSYPDHQLRRLLESGTRIRCLFLDPTGDAIRAREAEENYTDQTLQSLTALNISILTRLRARLDEESAARLEIRVYDETIRFNILIVDGTTCVVQPYLPAARGVDSPTLVMTHDESTEAGLFPVFAQVFTSLWERSTPV